MKPEAKKIAAFGITYNSLRMLIGSFSVLYLLSNGLDIVDVGLIKSLKALIIFTLDIPLSYLADKYSRKVSVLLGMTSGAVWLLISALASNKTSFYAAEFFNALSMIFYNNAFFAYLISSEKTEGASNIQVLLSKVTKIQFFMMGICALIGSMFVDVSSSSIWYLSALLVAMLTVSGFMLLPTDKVIHSTEKTPLKSMIYNDLKKIRNLALYSNRELRLVFLRFLSVNVFYQIIIQFWQPLSDHAIKLSDISIDNGKAFTYGILFVFILMVQSCASILTEKVKKTRVIITLLVLLDLFASLLLWLSVESRYGFIMFSLSLLMLFFTNRAACTVTQSIIYDSAPDEIRATTSAALATVVRIFVFIIMPLVSIALHRLGYVTVLYLVMLYVCMLYLRKSEPKIKSTEISSA